MLLNFRMCFKHALKGQKELTCDKFSNVIDNE